MSSKEKNKSIDPRLIQTVRNLKQQTSIKSDKNGIFTVDNSSDKTSGDSSNEEKNTNNKNNIKNKTVRASQNINSNIINNNRIAIEASDNVRKSVNFGISSKIEIVSKNKTNETNKNNNKNINKNNNNNKNNDNDILTKASLILDRKNIEKLMKTTFKKRNSKYLQSLLSDLKIKTYKQNCISIIKEDSEIKNLFEKCRFENTNFSYENFVEKNFFTNKVFMYKLEMLLLNDNFGKKNFKENFFKKEILNFLNNLNSDLIFKENLENLEKKFQENFDFINNFDFLTKF